MKTDTLQQAEPGSLQRPDKLQWLEMSQIAAMFLIVLHHSIPNYTESAPWFMAIADEVHYAALAVFFWASGYLVVYTDAIHKYGYGSFLKKNFIRLMVPYFCINLLMLIPKYAMGLVAGKAVPLNVFAVLYSFIDPRGSGILPHLWFLPTLMMLAVIAPLIIQAKKNWMTMLGLIVVALILRILPASLWTKFLCIDDLRSYFFFYALGIALSGFDLRRFAQNKNLEVILLMIGYVVSLLLFKQVGMVRFGSSILGFLFIFGLAFLLESQRKILLLSVFGGMTFTIYLLSLPAQNFIEVIADRLSWQWYFASGAMYVTGFAVPMAIYTAVLWIDQKVRLTPVKKMIGIR
ncbi:MAG: acyltransferase [Deltaproteobacteria bacterium]